MDYTEASVVQWQRSEEFVSLKFSDLLSLVWASENNLESQGMWYVIDHITHCMSKWSTNMG